MGEKENMQHETYKKDKEIKKTAMEIQGNVEKIKEKVEKVNKELKKRWVILLEMQELWC